MITTTGNRDTLHMEDAEIVEQLAFAGDQYLLRLHAPNTANKALPGNFVHLRCDDRLPMRRPMSIMRADTDTGCIEILYKVHGRGTGLLARRKAGDYLSLIGPIGVSFKQSDFRPLPLLIGGGVGIPPMIFLAEHLRRSQKDTSPLVLMGSEVPFPFQQRPSRLLVPGTPDGVIAAMPLLDDWGIPSRLASTQGFPGCFDGLVTALAHTWLTALRDEQLAQVEIFSCGPTAMLRAVAKLAADFELPCQVSLEEYMACAVGGCAGCAVPVFTDAGLTMQRVCVDGPVFDAARVFMTTD